MANRKESHFGSAVSKCLSGVFWKRNRIPTELDNSTQYLVLLLNDALMFIYLFYGSGSTENYMVSNGLISEQWNWKHVAFSVALFRHCLEWLGKTMENLHHVSRSLGPPEYEAAMLNIKRYVACLVLLHCVLRER
jgi:hypothetical protein